MSSEPEDNQNQSQEMADSYLSELEDRVFHLMHDIPESVHKAFRRHRRSAFERHPFVFSTLGLLGLVCTWQGFAGIVNRIQFLQNNPVYLLAVGLLLLLMTGRLYRHLDRQE